MILSWIGAIIAIGAILVGNALEGGHIEALIQPTAAMIVFGGTLGAVLLGVSTKDFVASMKGTVTVFFKGLPDYNPIIQELIELASVARKEGLVALDRMVPNVKNEFLKAHLRHVVDGYDPEILKAMMEEQIEVMEEEGMAAAKVWETGGGFAPTVGILGAVLGLIHVMSNLSDSSKLGAGIAVAFVATVYGVGAANLLMLPIANKLKKFAVSEAMESKLIYTGLNGIQNGLNPRIIEERLYGMLGEFSREAGTGGGGGGAEQKAA